MGGVAVVGEQHDGTTGIACGEYHVLQRITGFGFCIDDDQIGLQLVDTVGQEHVGRQSGNQVEAAFQQTNAQGARAFGLAVCVVVTRVVHHQVGRNHDDAQGRMWLIFFRRGFQQRDFLDVITSGARNLCAKFRLGVVLRKASTGPVVVKLRA
jgi:hypothetical protein